MCTIGNRERRLFDLMKSTEMVFEESERMSERANKHTNIYANRERECVCMCIHDQNANT